MTPRRWCWLEGRNSASVGVGWKAGPAIRFQTMNFPPLPLSPSVQAELQRKRAALSASLQSLADQPSAAASAEAASAQQNGGRGTSAVPVADAKEVSRVLSCNSDYACLKVRY